MPFAIYIPRFQGQDTTIYEKFLLHKSTLLSAWTLLVISIITIIMIRNVNTRMKKSISFAAYFVSTVTLALLFSRWAVLDGG